MAYTHSKYEVEVAPYTGSATGASNSTPSVAGNGLWIAVTGIVGRWAPGYVPHLIRGAAVVRTGVTTEPDGAIHIGFQADISALGTPTRMFTIVVPTSGAIHKSIYYAPTYEIEVKPGAIVDVNVTAAATAGQFAKVILYVEPRWEIQGNVSSMLATT